MAVNWNDAMEAAEEFWALIRDLPAEDKRIALTKIREEIDSALARLEPHRGTDSHLAGALEMIKARDRHIEAARRDPKGGGVR